MRQEFSKATKLAAWRKSGGYCDHCCRKLFPGNTEYHHDKECTFGGAGTLANVVVLCRQCHAAVTSRRAAVIAQSNRQRNKHLGIRRKPSRWRGWRKFNGEIVWNNKKARIGAG